MKAVRYHRPKKVSVDEVPDPKIEDPRDVVLRVTSTAICGSDLHVFNGLLPQAKPFTLGHEFMGVVEEVHGVPTACERSNDNYGPEGGLVKEKGGGLFGYTSMYGGYEGGQAERVRVPFADYGPRVVPDRLRDEEVLLLTDVFPTGWTAATWAEVGPESTVAVFGSGPVGLMAMKAARLKGAAKVIAVDPLDYRLRFAREAGGAHVTIDPDEEDAVERVREETDGRGADVAIDAVGMEAERNARVHRRSPRLRRGRPREAR